MIAERRAHFPPLQGPGVPPWLVGAIILIYVYSLPWRVGLVAKSVAKKGTSTAAKK